MKIPRKEPAAPPPVVPEDRIAQRIAREYLRLKTSNYFQALRITPDASPEAVDRAYIEMRTELHLDTPPRQLPDSIRRRAREIGDILKRAHRLLSKPLEREVYRAGLRLPDLEEEGEIMIEAGPESLDRTDPDIVAGEQPHLEGRALMERQEYTAAAEKFSEAIELNELEPTFRVALGRAVLATGTGGAATARAGAMACMHQALQLDPSHIEANVELARLFVEVGLGVNARPLLERVLRRAPENQQARRLLAEVES